jgi:hypothetical protein
MRAPRWVIEEVANAHELVFSTAWHLLRRWDRGPALREGRTYEIAVPIPAQIVHMFSPGPTTIPFDAEKLELGRFLLDAPDDLEDLDAPRLHVELQREYVQALSTAGPGRPQGVDTDARPETPTAGDAEGDERPEAPFFPLTSWDEIFASLNRLHGAVRWKNDEPNRNKIRKLNEQHRGPIRMPTRGGQPQVDEGALTEWYNGLREHFDNRVEEAERDAESARLTAAETHGYGATGTVVPGIGGHVKKSRKAE